jgi:hypothetical protein
MEEWTAGRCWVEDAVTVVPAVAAVDVVPDAEDVVAPDDDDVLVDAVSSEEEPVSVLPESAPPLALVSPAWTEHTGQAPGPWAARTFLAMAI